MTDTPKTDAVAATEGNWDTKALRMENHARKLERECNELRKKIWESTTVMKWKGFKDELKWEWSFHKRNPELLILMLIMIGPLIYFILKETLWKN